ncbi:hypothetical protein IQ22_04296 [Pseudomonas duriflava]|uniref:DUF3299 domain-containing protein n=1 Tax=Pseudomonas duriflava TaxID=459528 RepID=A0A562PTL8_9PSED|nr:DUF3299 domain-containing protein [Pseudomonas duriflava]TWI47784.1 hypothetical protein IQ22_04296 [Pseudomonas duriflava]
MRYRFLAILLIVLSCSSAYAQKGEPPETDWLALMPMADRKALEDMPEITHDTPEAPGGFNNLGGLKQKDNSLPEVMHSTRTVAALNGKTIRLGGYPVPLESNAKGDFVEFFLVPYPGACIHVPPPPPNQIILVRYPKGIPLPDIYEPYWVIGPLKIEKTENDLAEASYTLDATKVRKVEEADL